MKKYFIHALFPELKAAHAEQAVTVEAASFEIAAKHGLRELRSRAHIKGKRITEVSLRILVAPSNSRTVVEK